jgi:hypothetical protein
MDNERKKYGTNSVKDLPEDQIEDQTSSIIQDDIDYKKRNVEHFKKGYQIFKKLFEIK